MNLAKAQIRKLKRDWSGLVNGVLRALIREPSPPWPSIHEHARGSACRPVFGSRMAEPALDRTLGITEYRTACEQVSSIPPMTLRVNRLKSERNEFLGAVA